MDSRYNGYSDDGRIDTHTSVVPYNPNTPDPFDNSSEWHPNKIGLSVGYLRLRRTV